MCRTDIEQFWIVQLEVVLKKYMTNALQFLIMLTFDFVIYYGENIFSCFIIQE